MRRHHHRSGRRARIAGLLSLLIVTAGIPSRALAIAGKGGKFEFAIDAPWRMEPSSDATGKVSYGAIPIVISIHDALFSAIDEIMTRPLGNADFWTSTHHLGRFVELIITQVDEVPGGSGHGYPAVRLGLADLNTIERTLGVFRHDVSSTCFAEPRLEVCHPWQDSSCGAAAQWINGTSEWHALLDFHPQGPMAPGTIVHLQVLMKVSRMHARINSSLGTSHEVMLDEMLDDPPLDRKSVV